MENQNNPKESEKIETASTSPPPPPPSLSSSPSHEFSFTISFHAAAAAAVKLSKSSSSPLDFVDLSPADDIFFNGHLLPLHFVSHRRSDVSIHDATFLPLSQIEIDEVCNTAAAASAAVSSSDYNERSSPKSFPLFWIRKWLKGNDCEEADRVEEKQRKHKIKKKVLNLSRLWKKYTIGFVEPFLFLKDWKVKREMRRSTHEFSFSGDGRRRGGMSAPASVWTSPPNSGLLVTPPAQATTTNFSSEELRNAVQAAIVHCKNSIAVDEGKQGRNQPPI